MLDAEIRDPALKAKSFRSSGRVPAVYYGRGKQGKSLALNYQKFLKIFTKAGENTIIELLIDGKKTPVLVHDVQYDPVSDHIQHVDFIHVDMDKEVMTFVKVNIVGTAPAVKNLAGILDVQKHGIKIKCLPKDLIHQIDVDVSGIIDFHTSIHVKDLVVPKTIKVLDKPNDTVVTVVPPRKEEETKPAAALPTEGAAASAGAPVEGTAPAPDVPASQGPQATAARKEGKK